jgi:diacylglycerol kinase (ATP)
MCISKESAMEKSHRYPLIFNPKARSQKGEKMLRFLMGNADRFTMYATGYAGEARELAAKFVAAGEPLVIAAGGDGTLNEVVNGLSGSDTILGVLPAGTMNVFAREMRIPFNSLEKAFQVIERGFVTEVDVFEANGAPFVQMAGVGFDARVIEETTWESKKILGPLAYLLAGIKVMGSKPPKIEIICADGRREEGIAVLAGNGALYGGPFKFFRNANNHDSKLDVMVYKDSCYRLVLDSLRGLAFGGIDLMESTTYFQTSEFIVRSESELPVQVDGELASRSNEIRFAQSANRLRVIAPENAAIGSFSITKKPFMHWPRQAAAITTSKSS